MSGLGVSIKRPHHRRGTKEPLHLTLLPPTKQHNRKKTTSSMKRDLNYYWQEYAGRMPKEQVAIAKRMQNMRITFNKMTTTFEAVGR